MSAFIEALRRDLWASGVRHTIETEARLELALYGTIEITPENVARWANRAGKKNEEEAARFGGNK